MVALLAAASQARAGTATLDTGFGSGGVVTTDVFGQGAVNALVLVTDSQSLRIVAAGTNNNVTVLARYLENGTLDSAFTNPGGGSSVPGIVLGAQGSAEAIVRLANGNLLTGGGNTFTLNGFLVNGAFAGTESFPSAGGFSLGTMHELIAVGDGTFLAAGEGYANRCALGKLDSSLKLDATFTGGGITQQPLGELSCRGLVRDPGTGQIYVTATRTPGGTNGFGIARFSSSGALDTAFGSGGVALVPGSDSFSVPRAMTRQPDGKLIVVGTAGSGLGAIPKAALVARFNSDGTLDPTFGPAGVGLTVFGDPSATVAFNATAVVLQDDGRVLVGATVVGASNVKDGTGPSAFVVTRFTASGQYDVAFGDDPSGTFVVTPFGAGVSADLRAMALQPDGKLLVAGAAGTTQTRFALARYNVSGASVTPSSSTTTTTLPGAGGAAAAAAVVAVVAAAAVATEAEAVRAGAPGPPTSTSCTASVPPGSARRRAPVSRSPPASAATWCTPAPRSTRRSQSPRRRRARFSVGGRPGSGMRAPPCAAIAAGRSSPTPVAATSRPSWRKDAP